jgi:hypothetical protein
MQLTGAMYHFALAVTYQEQEMTWEKSNVILIVCHHFNAIIFSVTGNTYTLIASTNNLEGGCYKLKKNRLSVKVHIATVTRWDCKFHILCRSIITSFAKQDMLPIRDCHRQNNRRIAISSTDDYIQTWEIVALYWHQWQDRQHIGMHLSAGVRTTCTVGLAAYVAYPSREFAKVVAQV